MDQYVIDVNFSILLVDFIELVGLIQDSNNTQLKEYLPEFNEIINNEFKQK